jgi:hypothetical protein
MLYVESRVSENGSYSQRNVTQVLLPQRRRQNHCSGVQLCVVVVTKELQVVVHM